MTTGRSGTPASWVPDETNTFGASPIGMEEFELPAEVMREINVAIPVETPEQVAQYLLDDTAKNKELIKATNIKLE